MYAKHIQKNQTYIFGDNGEVHFFSYDTHIATITHGKLTFLSTAWDYSATTRKYFYPYLHKYTKPVQRFWVNDEYVTSVIISELPQKELRKLLLEMTDNGDWRDTSYYNSEMKLSTKE